MSVVEKAWKRRDPHQATVERLRKELDCHPVVASILVNRGITEGDGARRALEPSTDEFNDPTTLADVPVAVDRLITALESGETVSVYGDRDLDGVAGTALLVTLLQERGATVGYHVPGKWDGYGVHEDALVSLADRGTDLLITVDCGTTAHDELATARSLGMDVIVADHHPPDGPFPDILACINPHRPDCRYPNTGLAGAGVAFQLGEAMLTRYGDDDRSSYRAYALPLAALATVADRAAITPENRAIVRTGFDRLERCSLVGFREIVDACDIESVRDLGWSVAPLLNAAQEDVAGHLMLQAVLATDRDRIRSLIDTLETLRAERSAQRREWRRTVEQAVTERGDPTDDVLVVETDGYVGNAPSRIAERFGKPVLSYYPKGRGYRGRVTVDGDVVLRDVVEACGDLLDDVWGHPRAPRFEVPQGNVSAFVTRFREELRRRSPEALQPHLEIDAALDPAGVGPELVAALERLRPFGDGFDEPRFLVKGLDIDVIERFGRYDEHVALVPANAACRCVWWGGWDTWHPRSVPGRYDVVGTVSWDGDRDTAMMAVDDVRESGTDP